MNGTRLRHMKARIDTMNDGIYRTSLYTIVAESLRRTGKEPVQIRRAKGIAHLLDKVPLKVFPDELLAGSAVGLWQLEKNLPSYEEQRTIAIRALEEYVRQRAAVAHSGPAKARFGRLEDEVYEGEERWALMSRVHHDANIGYDRFQKLMNDMERRFAAGEGLDRREISKVLEAALRLTYDKDEKKLVDSLPWMPSNHLGYAYWNVTRKGLGAMRKDIEAKLAKAQAADKKEFRTAALIVVKAMTRFIRRYAGEIDAVAARKDTSHRRARELAAMSAVCRTIAVSGSRTFREALQTVWLLHIMGNIIGGSALSFSRFDQYMYEYYAADLKRGVPREELKELLACFWLKVNEPKLRTVQSLTAGGLTPDGKDAANDLTRMCLEVAREMKLPYPNIGVRISDLSPEWLYQEVARTIRAGCGQPMILNDRVFVPNLLKIGYPSEAANDYYNMGCVELMIPGAQPTWGVVKPQAWPLLLQNVLRKYIKGEVVAGTFEQFMEAYLDEMKTYIRAAYRESFDKKESLRGRCYDAFASILTDDCIRKGKDINQGGSKYPRIWSIYSHGIGTLADSLCAIRKFVYREKKLSLRELIEALNADFRGHERLQVMLDRFTPAYGNDNDEVDELAARVFEAFTREIIMLNKGPKSDKYVSTFFSYFSHVLSGEIIGAGPNGRHRGETLSDSMGPSQGKDTGGPTRMLNSVLKLDTTMVTGGFALNIKVNPSLFRDSRGFNALIALIKAYLKGNGPQIQVNFVDAEVLKDARIHPEKHRDLVVRVGGYCEYFVNLDRSLQTEIIERTAHEAA